MKAAHGLALLLLLSGCVTYVPNNDPFGMQRTRSETEVYDPEQDYAFLRRYDQNDHEEDRRVLEAAYRVFTRVRFTDMLRSQLELLIGPPIDTYGLNGKSMAEYTFDDGEQGVAVRFEFYDDDDGNPRIFALEKQITMEPLDDDEEEVDE
jgi:hypothetical protein